ncbi:SDR family oxidoreductase [Nocardia sp. BMG111209]|uniref:SDR family NAD(P)-dependent oxidoreductase n=1 Tax=Nocardia sp. BMG111209 TaxID=1160137 RepID=UPI0003610E6B|nr:SDR family NAD(P)-dependent oxidoreductase [Nocardia sp. BMG111209]
MKDLKDRTVLLTGASGGIGKQVARLLAAQGAHVALVGRQSDILGTLAEELRGAGVKAEPVIGDLADLESLDDLVDRAEQALGPIDVLINNAGVELAAALTRYEPAELNWILNVNLTAPMLLTRRVLPGMAERGRGHVVFVSSGAAKVAPAYQAPYAATKAGLAALSQSLRAEYSNTPLGFSVVLPGFVKGDGMYQVWVDKGVKASPMLGSTTVDRIAGKIVGAIRRDKSEVLDMGMPVRSMFATTQLSPGFADRLARRMSPVFRTQAKTRDRL